jgi:hypothetical protein
MSLLVTLLLNRDRAHNKSIMLPKDVLAHAYYTFSWLVEYAKQHICALFSLKELYPVSCSAYSVCT